jgi:hypothetical protein
MAELSFAAPLHFTIFVFVPAKLMGKLLSPPFLIRLAAAVSVLGLTACPSPWVVNPGVEPSVDAGQVRSQPGSLAPAQMTSLPAPAPAAAVPFQICADLPDWQRSPEATHLKSLADMPRYGSAIDSEPLKSLLQNFWGHQVFSFTTYGLSARSEPLYFSGVWTAIDATNACYDAAQPEQINSGVLAELWLINHRIVDLSWSGESYVLTVEPTATGLQFVQFDRQETAATLPLVVRTSAGAPVDAFSGDW